jgi:nitrate/nitrite-specific signal transduction histidine kinase
VLTVQDDGMGMGTRPLGTEGLGLRIMSNHVAIVAAHLAIEPAKSTDTVVTCSLVQKNHLSEQD